MTFTTGSIENRGNLPDDAAYVRVEILNRTGVSLTGTARSFKVDGTRALIQESNYNVSPNSASLVTLSLSHPTFGGALHYEVEIVPNQTGGIYTVYGKTSQGLIIDSQRILHSELTDI